MIPLIIGTSIRPKVIPQMYRMFQPDFKHSLYIKYSVMFMHFSFREDWKPVLTINAIVYGIQYLFLEPNPDDPLNKGKFHMRKLCCCIF